MYERFMPEKLPEEMSYTLLVTEWPLVLAGLRLEGSPESLAIADRLDLWLDEVKRVHAAYEEAMVRLRRYQRPGLRRKAENP